MPVLCPFSIFQVRCLFMESDGYWNESGMSVGEVNDEYIECLSDHLSSFTVVILDAEVR